LSEIACLQQSITAIDLAKSLLFFCQMANADLRLTTATGANLARVLLVINFVLLLALIGPGNSHQLYLAERKMGIAHLIVRFAQFWFVGSTVIATILFARIVVSKSEIPKPTKLDWALLLGWWFVIALF